MTSHLYSIFIILQVKGEIGPEKELVVTFNMGNVVICLAANGVIRIKFSDTRVEQNMGSVLNDHT